MIADELTRDGIFDAIRDLRVYSTEDKNLEVTYKVNGSLMGSTLDAPDALNILINIIDPDDTDKIGKVTIIANGGVEVASKSFDSNEAL
ncbi:MAG: LPXTG-motif cell wall anchor domain protein, partial [Clostridia bacterium]|nr:LPXTG-motif cell wall anchor domain protein [Clostridia bacterium]